MNSPGWANGQAPFEHHLVEIDGQRYGSGYSIGRHLVLTAQHVVGSGHTCRVRPLWSRQWQTATVVWPTGECSPSDVVLLRMASDESGSVRELGGVRWGVLRPGERVRFQAAGFPWTMAGRVQPDGTQVRDTDQVWGWVVPMAGLKSGRLILDVDSTPRAREGSSSWAGISGAAVLAWPGGQLLGVILSDQRRSESRLAGVPITELVAQPEFAQLAGVTDADLEQVAGGPSPLEAPYKWLPPNYPDSWLLDARYGIVPFLDVADYIRELMKWCEDEHQFNMGCLLGEGGSGKSRMAAELCFRMLQRGWHAGVVRTETGISSWEEFDPLLPTLIVFDYAENVADLGRIAWNLSQRRSRPPVQDSSCGTRSWRMVGERRESVQATGFQGRPQRLAAGRV